MAIQYRKWFIDRYLKELESVNKQKTDHQDVNHENIASLKSYEDMINKKFSKDI